MPLITRQFGPNPKGSKLNFEEMDENLLLSDNTVKYVAAESIPAGVAVSSSLYEEGEVVRTKNELDYTSLPNGSDITAHKCFKVSNNKSLYLGIDEIAGPTGLYAVIIENSGDVISGGTSVTVCPSFDTINQLFSNWIDAILIDTDKFLVSYFGGGNINFQVLEISGNSISSGSEYSTSYSGTDGLSSASPTTDEAIIAYGSEFVSVSVTGTVCNIGTPAIFTSNLAYRVKIAALDSDRIFFSWQEGDPDNGFCKVYQISIDTFGSSLTFISSGISNLRSHMLNVVDTDKVVISTKEEGNGEITPLKFIVIDTTSDPLVITDTYNWKSKTFGYYDNITDYQSENTFIETVLLGTNRLAFIVSPYVDLGLNFGSSTFLRPIVISVVDFSSGYQEFKDIPIFVQPSVFSWANYVNSNIHICEVGNERINISFIPFNNSPSSGLKVVSGQIVNDLFVSSKVNSTFTSYIGLSQTGASAGQSIWVKSYDKIDNTLTGLEPDTYYFVLPDGTLDHEDVFGYANSGGFRLLVGKAIASDKLQLINYLGFQ
jgi:hypothetical protein